MNWHYSVAPQQTLRNTSTTKEHTEQVVLQRKVCLKSILSHIDFMLLYSFFSTIFALLSRNQIFFVLSFGNNNILSTKEQNREEESVSVILRDTTTYYQNRLFKRTVNIKGTKKFQDLFAFNSNKLKVGEFISVCSSCKAFRT